MAVVVVAEEASVVIVGMGVGVVEVDVVVMVVDSAKKIPDETRRMVYGSP